MRRLLVVSFVLWGMPGVAGAQDAPPAAPLSENEQRAKQRFHQASEFYQDEDYVAAAALYEEAARLYGLVARDASGTVVDEAALKQQGVALFYEGSAYTLANELVEASSALSRYREQFGAGLPDEERKTLDQAITGLETRIGSLLLRGLPPDAQVLVDSRALDETPKAPIRLAMGDHLVEVRAPKKKPYLKTVAIAGQKELPLDVKLEPNETPARVRIEANVDDANVVVDGAPVGTAPVELSVTPGQRHAYRVNAEAYRNQDGDFEVEPGERTLIKVGMVRRRAQLGLRTEPYFLGTFYLRTDTPFKTASAGAGVHVFYDKFRFANFRNGFSFEANARDLDTVGVGVVTEWCPDRFADRTGLVSWCPLNVEGHITFGGHANPGFGPGTGDGRVDTAVEVRDGDAFARMTFGLGFVTYKNGTYTDNPDNQWLMTSHLMFAVGIDL